MKRIISIISNVAFTQIPETDAAKNHCSVLSDTVSFVGRHQSKAMVLGVFHFNDAGLDTYKPKHPYNILDANRQDELNILLDKLASYKPTKILIEWNRIKMDSITNIEYQKYLSGEFDLSTKSNEVYQIGFKLAKRMGHERIYCSDATADWFGVELDWDNYDMDGYLKSRNQYEKMVRYNFDPLLEYNDSIKTTRTLYEHLLKINEPSDRLKNHQIYLAYILEGAGDNYLGADNVARWYRRNLRIFSNAYDITDFNKEERLLLIYGSGHVWQLRQFFKESPDFEYLEVVKYLD